MPIALTDEQLATIQKAAEPLRPSDRGRYLERVAELLRDQVVGDGVVSRAARQAQAEVLCPPSMYGGKYARLNG